jgi:hypothetical protein
METPWHVNVNFIVVVIVIVSVIDIVAGFARFRNTTAPAAGPVQHATFNLRGDTNVRATVRRG